MANKEMSSLRLQRRQNRDLSLTHSFDDSFNLSDNKRAPAPTGIRKPLATLSRRMVSHPLLVLLVATIVALLMCLALYTSAALQSSLRALLCNRSAPATHDNVAHDRFAAVAARSRSPAWAHLSTLIIVAGHAIYTSPHWDDHSLHDERNWLLEHFQKGQVSTFLAHIHAGVDLAANDSSALLLFSGGQTRNGAGPRSEGTTYWSIANAADWYARPRHSEVANRSFAEEYARDSFENILFSICRFHQIVGAYPRFIKVVGFEFKRLRFEQLHRPALRFPAHRFQYVGIDPHPNVASGKFGMAARERATMGPFQVDPYGCHTPMLYTKRLRRNPYLRYHPYPQGCPQLASLFRYCGPSLFREPLPWDSHQIPQNVPVS